MLGKLMTNQSQSEITTLSRTHDRLFYNTV